jgi:hypothetical protein
MQTYYQGDWWVIGLATLMAENSAENNGDSSGQASAGSGRYDGQALIALIGGALLILISFFTNYSHGDIPRFFSLQVDEQIGLSLHLAAVAALVGEVELASRLRDRAADEADRAAIETAREREQAARRSRIQARCLVAQFRYLLADTATNRLQLSEALALLLEELTPHEP